MRPTDGLLTTGLLAYRLWRVDRTIREFKEKSRLGVVFQVVIEAGAIYTFVNVIMLVTFLRNSISVYVIRDLVS